VFGFDDRGLGGHAEYKTIAQDRPVASIPDGISYQLAAASTEGAHYALVYIRATKIRPGDRVLVFGATGAIGSAAVQLLVHAGAHVVATSPTRHVAMVASLGCTRVIDHELVDFTADGEQFRVVFDAVGKSSFAACKRLLEPGGIYVSTELGPRGENPILGLASPLFELAGARRVLFPIPTCTQEDIAFLRARLADGTLRPVIDRSYWLADVVDAFRYVETGKKIGNVVIQVVEDVGEPGPTVAGRAGRTAQRS
jgi:NADPH:quinone reductase-like Zn-dependent oxidoreductase